MSEMTMECEYCDGYESVGGDLGFAAVFIDKTGRMDVFDHGDDPILSAQVKYCPMCGRQFNVRPINMRPMTLEEAVVYGKRVWCELKQPTSQFFGWWTFGIDAKNAGLLATRRFWPDKPTPEQSAAWPWGGGIP